ncbi:MAG: hypothetical protein ACD_29C00268G0002 [uncultured bacterium]|nr:MAG: hypothetical protein ACD_29C00268G0002 [uncultured bacterium]
MRRYIKAGVVIIVLAGFYLASPYFFGSVSKRYINTFIQNENAVLGNALDMKATVQDYHRGWFHSTATFLIQKKVNGVFQNIKTIPVEITHGPFYQINGRLTGGLAVLKSTAALANMNYPYDITYRENISFDGGHTQSLLLKEKSTAVVSNTPHAKIILIRAKSNFEAKKIIFNITADHVQFSNATKLVDANAKTISVQLNANYIDNQHWNLLLGLDIGKNQISIPIHLDQQQQSWTVKSNQIHLAGLHIDTNDIATLLQKVISLKQENAMAIAANQPINPSAWLLLFQNTLSSLMQADTQLQIDGLSITTPYGTLNMRYAISFPTLADKHDYFDIVTRSVGDMQLTIPTFQLTNDKMQSKISLSNFTYNSQNNTIYTRNVDAGFDSFNMNTINPTQNAVGSNVAFFATGFLYHSDTQGDSKNMMQNMQWSLNKFCWSDDCFSNIKANLQLKNLNPTAFRGVAAASQQLMQYHPAEKQIMIAQWMDLINAYAQLVSSKTIVSVSENMTSPKGAIIINGSVAWPALPQTQTGIAGVTAQAQYVLHIVFPAAYITEFLNTTQADYTKQAQDLLHYLIQNNYIAQHNDAYVLDLTGQGVNMQLNGKAWVSPPQIAAPAALPQQ